MSAHDPALWAWDEAHERKRGHALAASGFADQAKRFPLIERERNPVDRPDRLAPAPQLDAKVGHLQQRGHPRLPAGHLTAADKDQFDGNLIDLVRLSLSPVAAEHNQIGELAWRAGALAVFLMSGNSATQRVHAKRVVQADLLLGRHGISA